MTAFASKGSAGRRHPRWWIVVLAAGEPALWPGCPPGPRRPASSGPRTRKAISGPTTAAAIRQTSPPPLVGGRHSGWDRPGRRYLFITDNYSFREVHTDPATGRWFVVRGDGQFKNVKATPVGGNVFEVTSKDSGQRFIMEDSTGKVVLRAAGVATYRYLWDTDVGDVVEFLGVTMAGHFPDVSLCSAAGSIFGIDSASRLTAHPLGATASPLGYYEYLHPATDRERKSRCSSSCMASAGTGTAPRPSCPM